MIFKRYNDFCASTIYQIFTEYFMARIGMIIVISGIIISMSVAMYTYTQYQPNFINAKSGEPVIVGPVEYTISFDGTHKGNKEKIPENIFVKIRITAKNIKETETSISGGQFYLVDDKQQKHQPIYGEFSEEDLLEHQLEPNRPVTFTTQFDIPYEESKQYNIMIRPTKQQSSVDTAIICITNC
jgi:hypothetical protein